MNRIFLDIETHAVSADDPRWLAYRAAREEEPIEAPGNYGEEAAARYVAKAREAMGAKLDALRWDTALDPMLGSVAVLAWAVEDGEVQHAEGEDAALDALETIGAQFRERRERATWIGHNIDGFDAPFLSARGLRAGRPAVRDLFGRPGCKPWERPTLDTRTAWPSIASYGPPRVPVVRGINGASLPSVARALGLPVEDTAPGSECPRLWEAGDRAAVVAHCRADVALCRDVYRRIVG